MPVTINLPLSKEEAELLFCHCESFGQHLDDEKDVAMWQSIRDKLKLLGIGWPS